MRIDKAIETVQEYYTLAKKRNELNGRKIIRDPVAWALYQTWIDADKGSRKKVEDGKNNQE